MKDHVEKHILSRYIDGELSDKFAASVRVHLDACEDCRGEVSNMKMSNDLLGTMPGIEASEHFDFEFNQKLEKALALQAKSDFPKKVTRKFRAVIKEIFIPRVPVLVRVAITMIFMGGALFTGTRIYYTKTELPSVTNIKGDAFIRSMNSDSWRPLKTAQYVRRGDLIKCDTGYVDISIKSKYCMRIKENALIKVAGLSTKYRPGVTQIDLRDGDILVDIGKGYKGSKFDVSTSLANVQALGTKFAVSSENIEAETWVGVLEGKVRVNAKFKADIPAGMPGQVLLLSGMKTWIVPGEPITEPLPLVEKEWQKLSELYMLGEKTKVALLISSSKNRVLELLAPCTIYITDEKPRTIPPGLEEAAYLIDRAIAEDDKSLHLQGIETLEGIVRSAPEGQYNVNLLLFIGAYYNYLDMYDKAANIFTLIAEVYPESPLVSLAECAKAYIYEASLKDPEQAIRIYKEIIEKYPVSPEADFARSHLN